MDFWSAGKDYDYMKLLHQQDMYPPRVTFNVSSDYGKRYNLKISFEGSVDDDKLATEIPLNFSTSKTVVLIYLLHEHEVHAGPNLFP